MPFEIKRHTVSHLKGLEPLTRCERGSTFTLHHTTLKSAHFPYKQAKQRFHMNIAVPILLHTEVFISHITGKKLKSHDDCDYTFTV